MHFFHEKQELEVVEVIRPSEALFHSVAALITKIDFTRIMFYQDLVSAAFTAVFGRRLPSNSIHQLFSQTHLSTVPLWQPPSSSPFRAITSSAHNGIIVQNPIQNIVVDYLDLAELDPRFHFDFQNVIRPYWNCFRGNYNYPYQRPYGWYRIALNVLGRYQDGNIWLGPNGLRNAPVKGEWPVSYHGTNIEFVHNIIKQGLRPGPSARFGIGIYSSPIIEMIERMGYAKAFKHNGKVYKVALQNRVDPDHLQIIPAVFTGTGADYWLSKSGGIRPYGVLIKEVAIGC